MKRKIALIVSVGGAFFLLFLLLRTVSSLDRTRIFRLADWHLAVLAFFLYGCVNIVRGYRFYVLLDGRAPFRELVGVAFVHNFLTNLLPFRSGELSYPYLLRKRGLQTLGEAAGSLVVSRLFDIFVFVILFFGSWVALGLPRIWAGGGTALIWVFGGIILFVVSFFIFFAERLVSFLLRLLSVIRLERFHFFREIVTHARDVGDVFKRMKRGQVFLWVLAVSLAVWIANFFVDMLLLQSVGVRISFGETMFAFSLPIIVSEFSPVQLFGNFGVFEWSLIGGLLLLGVPYEAAALSSLAVHLQGILFSLVLAIAGAALLFLGWVRESLAKRRNQILQ